jgi:glycosyltransferase involved in cell wall biosynthesis
LDKHLHIITLDVPWPADYGGVVDLFYKIVSLHKAGVKIHLHCFTAGRAPQDILLNYCVSVNYYSRKKMPGALSAGLPYIVSSRINKELLQNLQKDDYPVLMEGVHCTYYLYNGALKNRKVFVRLHNVEYNYYRKLASHESNVFKKLYFYTESILLKRYEKKIATKATFWPVSIGDTELYKKEFGANKIDFLPVFVPWSEVLTHDKTKGHFCLYHGNLAVNENEKAAEWLLKEVFNDIDIPLVIAGKNPSPHLEKLAHVNKNTCLVSNLADKEMQDLIKKAQVNILPSLNNTGVKLKLLNALYNGRYCLVNDAASKGVAIDNLCHIANDAASFKKMAIELYSKPYENETSEERQEVLNASYNNDKNAQQLIAWIY